MENKGTQFQDIFSEEVWSSTYKDHRDTNVNDTFRRVAKSIASAETTEELKQEWEEKFYDLLTDFKGVSGGRITANAGTDWAGTTFMNCVSAETLIHTKEGLKQAHTLRDKTVEVLSRDGVFRQAKWKSYGVQKLLKVILENDEILYATGDHKWVVSEPKHGVLFDIDKRVSTINLVGKRIPIQPLVNFSYDEIAFKDGFQHGLVYGDGWESECKKYTHVAQFRENTHLIIDNFDKVKLSKYTGEEDQVAYGKNLPGYFKQLPVGANNTSYLRGFIAGLVASDGSIDQRGHVMIFQSDLEDIKEIRRIAAKAGIPSSSLVLYREKSPYDDTIKPLYCLRLFKSSFFFDKKLVMKNKHRVYIENSPEPKYTSTIKVISVEETDREEEVYCCEEPETHTMVIGSGILTGQCYVGPLPDHDLDSIEGIYKVLVEQAKTLKSEGGWGMNFSWIRPRGSFIKGIGVESPGSVRFMELFDKSSEIVTAGSGKKASNKKAKEKIRKGAMMGVLDVWHPDVVEFITAKQTSNRLSKFNISVNCTEEFMEKVNKAKACNEKISAISSGKSLLHESKVELELNRWNLELKSLDSWDLIFPDTHHENYKKEWNGDIKAWKAKGYPVVVHQTISVSWLWNLIMESTYNRNEPGVLFLDRANYYSPLNYHERILSTNPCGEQTLAPGGVCCLGTINLTQFIDSDSNGFDLPKLERYVGYMVRFLDNVNTISDAPLPEYVESMQKKRRIGCGVMGWGSALFMLKIRFGSKRAAELREQVMSTYARAAYMASIDLAEEKGKFEYCDPEKHSEAVFIKSLGLSDEYLAKLRRTGIRNSSLLSQQPNGNGSIFANVVTGGIEPAFLPEYVRTVIVNSIPDSISSVTPRFQLGEFVETDMFKFSREGDEEILRGVSADGTVYKIDRNRGLTKEVLCEDYGVRYLKAKGEWDPKADYAVTTTELSVEEHVEDLKGFAKWTDSACSKTANIPFDYPFEDFKNLYLDVYNTGVIKGFTTYRAGTMTSVLSAVKETVEEEEEVVLEEIKLPDSLPATLKTLRAEGRKWYLTVILNEAQAKPVALFAHTNNHEKSVTTNDAVDHLYNLAVTKGIPTKHIEAVIIKSNNDTNTTKVCRFISLCLRHGVLIRNVVSALDKVDCLAGSFVFHIRKYLASFIKDGEKVVGETCMECKSANIVYQEGCKVCKNCGSSKCG